MALIPCPECGRQVSERATACPNCGHPPGPAIQSSRQPPTNDQVVAELVEPASADQQPTAMLSDAWGWTILSLFTPTFIVFFAAAVAMEWPFRVITIAGIVVVAVIEAGVIRPAKTGRLRVAARVVEIIAILVFIVALWSASQRPLTPQRSLDPPPAQATAIYWRKTILQMADPPSPREGQSVHDYISLVTTELRAELRRIRTTPTDNVDQELVNMVRRHFDEWDQAFVELTAMANELPPESRDRPVKEAFQAVNELAEGQRAIPPEIEPTLELMGQMLNIGERQARELESMSKTLTKRYPRASFPLP